MQNHSRSAANAPARGNRVNSPAWALAVGGIALIGIGQYFLFFRPPLLAEDLRYMGTTIVHIKSSVPGLLLWLPKVFAVLGGYITAVGILTLYTAYSVRAGAPGALLVACISGAMSIGLMVVVNFVIASDFRWVLVVLASPWLAAVLLYQREMVSERAAI